ncbi:MAG: HWE histidine kinase domain-containing protein [Pseudomonadota bacterium]
MRVNSELAKINGIPVEDHPGRTVMEIVPDLGQMVVKPIEQVFETGEPLLNTEIVGRTAAAPDEDRTWIVDWYPVHRGRSSEINGVGVSVRDITKTKEMEADLRRVMQELQHRVKNMLANVMALINRARRDENDPAQVLDTLSNRITALAKTHNLLTAENWGATRLTAIVEPELTQVYGDQRISLRGPDVVMSAKPALAISMAIHELATNAAKYGGLSTPEGRVALHWQRIDDGDGDMLRMEWRESGGPKVEKPAKIGFGTQLVTATIEGSVGGKVRAHWEPDGLRIVMNIPYDRLNQIADDQYESSFDA